jgi:hypothetical protein
LQLASVCDDFLWGLGKFMNKLFIKKSELTSLLILISLIVFSAFFSLYNRVSLHPGDPYNYVQLALNEDSQWNQLGSSRIGLVLPLRIVATIFGESEMTYLFIPIFAMCALVLVTFLLGKLLFSVSVGAFAAILIIVNPITYRYTTLVYTDLLSATLVAWSVYLLLPRNQEPSPSQFAKRASISIPIFVWALLTKEAAVLALPVVAYLFYLGIVRHKISRLFIVLVAVCFIAIDALFGFFATANPFYRWTMIKEIATGIATTDIATQAFFVVDQPYWNQDRFWYATILPREILFNYKGGYVFLLALILSLFCILWFISVQRVIAIWSLSTVIPLFLASGSLNPDAPSVVFTIARYWLPFLVPVTLALCGTTYMLINRINRLEKTNLYFIVTASILVFVQLYQSSPVLSNSPWILRNSNNPLNQARVVLSGVESNTIVFSDWRTTRLLGAYKNTFWGSSTWTNEVADLPGSNECLDIAESFRDANCTSGPEIYPKAGDFLVIYSADSNACSQCRAEMNRWLKSDQGKEIMNRTKPYFDSQNSDLVILEFLP